MDFVLHADEFRPHGITEIENGSERWPSLRLQLGPRSGTEYTAQKQSSGWPTRRWVKNTDMAVVRIVNVGIDPALKDSPESHRLGRPSPNGFAQQDIKEAG